MNALLKKGIYALFPKGYCERFSYMVLNLIKFLCIPNLFWNQLNDKKNITVHSLNSLFKKRTKRVSQNRIKVRKPQKSKKNFSNSRKIMKTKNGLSFSSSIHSSLIIFAGLMSLSFTIFFLINQFQPFIKNERLKFLCTYQLDNKKGQSYKASKMELKTLVGDSKKYCENFLIPKEKKRFNPFSVLKDVIFRVVF